MAVGIGQLDRRITLQSYTKAQDAFGQSVKTWGAGTEIWARVITKSGSEGVQNLQETATNTVEFIIRFRAVTERDRVSYENSTYDITRIEEIGRHQYLKLIATKKDNE